MKQNVESREMDGYRVYLQGHLRDHHFPQRNNRKFIEQRVEDAYDRFVTLRFWVQSLKYLTAMSYNRSVMRDNIEAIRMAFSLGVKGAGRRLPRRLQCCASMPGLAG